MTLRKLHVKSNLAAAQGGTARVVTVAIGPLDRYGLPAPFAGVAAGVTVVFLEIVSVVVGLSTPFGVAEPSFFASVTVKVRGFPLGSTTSRGKYCRIFPVV